MSLMVVVSPQNESALSVRLRLLKANDIPVYVHNNGFGGLNPGPQIHMLNNRRAMVPAIYINEALDTLSVQEKTAEEQPSAVRPKRVDKLRIVLELMRFGWFIPGYRWRRQVRASAENHDAEMRFDVPQDAGE
jgi:hypothetical protein